MGMRRSTLVWLFLCACVASAAGAAPTITVASASLGGLSSLSVRCEVRGAAVRLDGLDRGQVPLDLTGLRPGGHTLSVAAEGYYEMTVYLSLAADTKTTVETPLERRTGYIAFSSDTPGATLRLEGKDYAPGLIEAASGVASVSVRAFGYVEREYRLTVADKVVTTLDASLERASFEAEGFRLSARRFNPLNSGSRGSVRIAFSVSAPGFGVLAVRDASGAELASVEIGPFETWEQSATWDGRDTAGVPAQDGRYELELTLRPAEGIESAMPSISRTERVEIDSTIIVVPSGAFGALPGAAHAPEAFRPAADGVRIDATALVRSILADGTTSGRAAVTASLSLEGLLEAGLGVDLGFAEPSAALVAVRVAAPLVGPFGLSAFADGRIAGDGDPAWARAGLEFGVGSRFVNLVAAPGALVRFDDGASFRADLRAALRAGGYSYGAALSAEAATGSLSEGFAIEWPLEGSLEAYLSPRGLPLTFRALFGLDLYPVPESWRLGAGVTMEF